MTKIKIEQGYQPEYEVHVGIMRVGPRLRGVKASLKKDSYCGATKERLGRGSDRLKLTVCRSKRNNKANCKIGKRHATCNVDGQSHSRCGIKDPRSKAWILESRSKIYGTDVHTCHSINFTDRYETRTYNE
jgi:hypothetical protein